MHPERCWPNTPRGTSHEVNNVLRGDDHSGTASRRSANSGAFAPVDPLVAGADHSHENHQGHGAGHHTEANLPFIDLSFAHFQIAIFTGEILTGADLRLSGNAQDVRKSQVVDDVLATCPV